MCPSSVHQGSGVVGGPRVEDRQVVPADLRLATRRSRAGALLDGQGVAEQVTTRGDLALAGVLHGVEVRVDPAWAWTGDHLTLAPSGHGELGIADQAVGVGGVHQSVAVVVGAVGAVAWLRVLDTGVEEDAVRIGAINLGVRAVLHAVSAGAGHLTLAGSGIHQSPGVHMHGDPAGAVRVRRHARRRTCHRCCRWCRRLRVLRRVNRRRAVLRRRRHAWPGSQPGPGRRSRRSRSPGTGPCEPGSAPMPGRSTSTTPSPLSS